MKRLPWMLAAVFAVGALALLGVPGMRFGAFVLLCLAAYCIALGLFPRFRRALLILLCVGLLGFCVLEALVVSGAGGNAEGKDVSCVVILGAGVNGTQPSLMLRARLDAALDFIADKPDIPVIVSGCQGKGEDITEAECMYRYLTARGVAQERVWKEELATSTRTNFACSMALAAERGLDPDAPFAYVTNDFHVYRAGVTAGVPWAYGVAARLPRNLYYDALEVNYFIREAFALANEYLLRMDLDL